MSLSDFLSILDIVITVLIGFVITHLVSVRDSRTRAIKDYYIQELASIKTEINLFYSKLYKGEYEAKDIIGWHTSIKNRVNSFDKAVRITFRLYDESLKERLFLNYKHITGSNDFNANYSNGKITFGGKAKRDIGQDERKLYLLIDRTLYDINNSRVRDYIERKYQEFKSHYYYYRTVEKKTKIKACVTIALDWINSHKTSIIIDALILMVVYFSLLSLGRFVKQNTKDKTSSELTQRLDSINASINKLSEKEIEVLAIDPSSTYSILLNEISSPDTITLRGIIKAVK